MRILLVWIVLTCALCEAQVYRLSGGAAKPSQVLTLSVAQSGEWLSLAAEKQDGTRFRVWLQRRANDEATRYILQEGTARAREYRDGVTGAAVLPSHGGWPFLLPQPPGNAAAVHYLGHSYQRQDGAAEFVQPPPDVQVVTLRPDLWIGQASNTRQKDETRRWDGSDYTLVRLTRDDYRTLRDAGVTCVRVDEEQWKWAEELGLYYWGAAKTLPFPEMLYRPNYIGTALFIDEPAVGTRDHVVRPRFAKDEAFRKAITPQIMLDEFGKHFAHVLEGAPRSLAKTLRARADVDLGTMDFVQSNLYAWETMVSTAAYQLTKGARELSAFVFEPPGRIGTRRTLPELDMTYGVQFAPDDPKALASIIFGFLRGAARAAGKQWGISIYGAFERADAPWWLTHAYDQGATRFFFWDNYQLACVPFGEVLSHARHLREHARAHPRPAPEALRRAAEVAILLPPGYDLGHVQTGKGNLWGIGELNAERRNRHGVPYRKVMSAFFTEVERYHKMGVPFDLLWDLPALPLNGYREVVRIAENPVARPQPPRASGAAPRLSVQLSPDVSADGVRVHAVAHITETAAKAFYTYGADSTGVYENALAAFELYGPDEQDELLLIPDQLKPKVTFTSGGGTAEREFRLTRPGDYRLRVSTVDTVGRSTVVWQRMTVGRAANGFTIRVH